MRILAVILALMGMQSFAVENDSVIHRQYSWQCDGMDKSCELYIDSKLLLYYKDERDHLAYRYSGFQNDDESEANYFGFMFSDYDRPVIRELAAQIADSSMPDFRKVKAALTFVQTLPYALDKDSKGVEEYVRYPLETLYDGTGDCEDKTILLAAVLQELGIDFILLLPPDHMALGVCCDSIHAQRHFFYDEKKYYYIESTALGWDLGVIPKQYSSSSFTIYPKDLHPALAVLQVKANSAPAKEMEEAECDLILDLFNMGPGRITGLWAQVEMVDAGSSRGQTLAKSSFPLADLLEGERRSQKIHYKSCIRKNTLLKIKVSGNEIPKKYMELKLRYTVL